MLPSALNAVASFTDPVLQAQLLTEIAQAQLNLGQIDEAFATLDRIADPVERRIIRQVIIKKALDFLPPDEALKLIDASPLQTAWLYRHHNPQLAAELTLAIPITPDIAEELSIQLRWLACAASASLPSTIFPGASRHPVLDTGSNPHIAALPQNQDRVHKLAPGFRRGDEQARNNDNGKPFVASDILLERAEAAALATPLQFTRVRLQCYLGKVLVELGKVDSIDCYLPIYNMLTILDPVQRAHVSVWLAEARWEEGVTQAINILSLPQRGVLEAGRVSQIVGVLRRFAFQQASAPNAVHPTGNPVEDEYRLSSEEFERFYYSPFNEIACNC